MATSCWDLLGYHRHRFAQEWSELPLACVTHRQFLSKHSTERHGTSDNLTEPRINVPSSRNLTPASGQNYQNCRATLCESTACAFLNSCAILSCAALPVVPRCPFPVAWQNTPWLPCLMDWFFPTVIKLSWACTTYINHCSCSLLCPAYCWHSPLVANWKSFQMLLWPSTTLDKDREVWFSVIDLAWLSYLQPSHWFGTGSCQIDSADSNCKCGSEVPEGSPSRTLSVDVLALCKVPLLATRGSQALVELEPRERSQKCPKLDMAPI
jgi:hypothetical protein